jgi:hypothetical protein
MNGFTLHAAVRCGADVRQALEQFCRRFTLPEQNRRARATQRRGPDVLKLKTRWGDDTTHRVMSPLEFMQKHINGRFVVAKSTGSMSAEGRGLSIDRVERTTGPGRVADVR